MKPRDKGLVPVVKGLIPVIVFALSLLSIGLSTCKGGEEVVNVEDRAGAQVTGCLADQTCERDRKLAHRRHAR